MISRRILTDECALRRCRNNIKKGGAKSAKGVIFTTIEDIVCRYNSISRDQLYDKNRNKRLVLARHEIMYLAKEYIAHITLDEIGKLMMGDGNPLTHPTVKHGIDRIKTDCEVNGLTSDIENLTILIDNKLKNGRS